jgi:cysteine desulfurase/selenocysteine lyase
MSTSEYRSVDAEGDLPISEAELAALATQVLAASIRPGNDSPPQTVPPAPRGSAPDTTSAASYAATAAGAEPFAPPAVYLESPSVTLPALSSPGPEPISPGFVPVAPRGSAPDMTTAPSAGHAASGVADVYTVPHLEGFAIPDGIVPTVPGVLAGATPAAPVAPRGSVPGWPTEAPGIPDLGLLSAPESTSAPTGDEANYYFTSVPVLAEPVPQIPDEHEIFDVNAIRADFPILRETVHGKPLIWFDNAATTQKPQAVIDRLAYFYAHENSNIHRAAHELAARATDAYEEARDTVRRFIGAPKDEQIIFVRGTTEAINLVAQSWGGKNLGPGDEIVITILEHHANIVPWQMISQKTGAVLKVAPVDDAGNLLLGEFEDLLGPRTKIVSATQVSNALGTVTPVEKIVELGHRYGARVLIDGAQSIPHIPIDVTETGADFFVFSGHKIFGPTGIGVLYGTEEALAETPPWQGGGNMIADVTIERSLYQGLPNKFEAGTGNIADAVGLGEALRYVEKVGIDRIASYEHALLEYATPRLADIPGVRLIGTADEKAGVLSFVLAGHEPLEVGKALNAEGIAVRAGHHCAQPILRRMGVETTVRPSFAFYNTFDEIDVFLDAVHRIAEGGTNTG